MKLKGNLRVCLLMNRKCFYFEDIEILKSSMAGAGYGADEVLGLQFRPVPSEKYPDLHELSAHVDLGP